MIDGSQLIGDVTSRCWTLKQHGGSYTIGDQLVKQQQILIVGPYTVNGNMIYTVYVTYNPPDSDSRLDFVLPLYNTEDVQVQQFSFKANENQATLTDNEGLQCMKLSVNSWKKPYLAAGNTVICHFNADQISNEFTYRIK